MKHATKLIHRPMILFLSLFATLAGVVFVTLQASATTTTSSLALASAAVGQQQIAAEKVMGREACAKCHATELKAWQASSHGKKSWALLSDTKAPDFAKKLGIPAANIQTSMLCTSCHGTPQQKGGQVTIAHGNSCESCHGAAGGEEGWFALHSDYGSGTSGKTMKELLAERNSETAAHRAGRLAACDKAGMNRSDNPLAIARNCLLCHTVPNEELVAAGHPTSDKFEFVRWAQGEVRHNFLLDPTTNAEAPSLWLARAPDNRTAEGRKRLMFVAGQLADLEVSLRNRANVSTTDRGTLGDEVNDRIDDAIDELEDLELDDLQPVLDIIEKRNIDKRSIKDITADDKKLYTAAADEVRIAAEAFLEKHKDGDGLNGVDVSSRAEGDVFEP